MARPSKNKSAAPVFPEHQTHGALPTNEQNTSSVVWKILNRYQKVPYKHTDVASYQKYLEDLTLSQLQTHAVETGSTIPTDDRVRLINRLVDEFCRFSAKNNINQVVAASGKTSNISGGMEISDGMTQENKAIAEDILKKYSRTKRY